MNARIHNYWYHRYQQAKTLEAKQMVATAYFNGDAAGVNEYLRGVEEDGGTFKGCAGRTIPD